jgi:hypothetical protein
MRATLEDFGRFWKEETDPEPRQELLQQLIDAVLVDGQTIVAIQPTSVFQALTSGAVRGTASWGRLGAMGANPDCARQCDSNPPR